MKRCEIIHELFKVYISIRKCIFDNLCQDIIRYILILFEMTLILRSMQVRPI